MPVFAGVLSFFNPNDFDNTNINYHLHTQAFFANDAFSIQTRRAKMRGDSNTKKGENVEIIDIRFDVGYSYYNNYLGYTYRVQNVISASKDMAELYHTTKNKKDLDTLREYNLKLKVDSFKDEAIVFAHTLYIYKNDTIKIKLGGAVELVSATKMQDWELSGEARAIDKKDYDLDIVSDSHYTKNYLYKLKVPKSDAVGYSSHLALDIFYEDSFLFSFLINDMFGKLYWGELPYSYVRMKTDNKTYDKNGYVKFQPSISGIEKESDYTQTLINKSRVSITYISDFGDVEFGSDYIYKLYLPYINYKYKITKNLNTTLGYEFRFNGYYGELRYKNYFLGVRADNSKEQQILAMNLGINF